MYVDFDNGPFDVTFPANQASVSFNVSLNEDDEVEKDEAFLLEIRSPDLPFGVTQFQDLSCRVTIIDTTGKSILNTI